MSIKKDVKDKWGMVFTSKIKPHWKPIIKKLVDKEKIRLEKLDKKLK